jgi:hypothetical protein
MQKRYMLKILQESGVRDGVKENGRGGKFMYDTFDAL